MKNKIVWLAKVFLSGVFALIILNLLACIYRGVLPTIADETMSTSYCYVPNSYFSFMQEGISVGYYDKNGYNNAYPEQEAIDYLVMGSSHMEARQVMPTQNTVYDLNVHLNSGSGSGYAYNIGISGERLPTCISRLRHAIDTYHPQKAVIIETSKLDFPQSTIEEALEEATVGSLQNSYGEGVMGFIKKLPYVRYFFIQMKAMMGREADDADDTADSGSPPDFESDSYTKRIAPLIEKASVEAEGLSIVIVYHPNISILSDGSMSINGNDEMIQAFREICEANQVLFIDMSERFLQEYNENFTVPYGFANTSTCSGHLNRNGHVMMADEIFKLFLKEGLAVGAP